MPSYNDLKAQSSQNDGALISPAERRTINKSWKAFWKKRGYDRPFSVNQHLLHVFDLPHHAKFK
jgi:hypothetical protein